MLKISIVDNGAQRRLVLEGALLSPSLMDLRTAWLRACARKQGRRIVLEFKNVTDISAEGEAALWDLMNRGVRFSSGGVLTKHVLQQLIKRNRPRQSARASRLIAQEAPASADGSRGMDLVAGSRSSCTAPPRFWGNRA